MPVEVFSLRRILRLPEAAPEILVKEFDAETRRRLFSDNLDGLLVLIRAYKERRRKMCILIAGREARRLGISLAELLRRSLRLMLPVDETKPWMRYAGMIETGDSQASQKIDEIVYGQKD